MVRQVTYNLQHTEQVYIHSDHLSFTGQTSLL